MLIIFIFIFILALISLYIYYTNLKESFTNKTGYLKIIEPDYNLNKYHPIGIKLRGIERRTNFKDSSISKKKLLKQYDYDTLIYNVFLSYDNKSLVIIGPPLFNLYEEFFPMHFKGFGLNLKIQKNRDKGFLFEEHPFFFKVTIPLKNIDIQKMNKVTFIFKNREIINLEVPINNYKCGARILVTKQKNNNLQWIKDWITHYQKRYNVSNIIIFDNNSDNTEQLCDVLTNKNGNKLDIIPYKYNFGVPQQHLTSFFQNTILEVAKLQFCRNGVIFFNFDIDELLQIIPSKLNTLIETNKGIINYNFREWRVPMTIDNKQNQEYSFKDFKYKNKKPSEHGYATKYVATIDNKTSLNIHFATTKKKKTYLDDCFFHFNGINTNWKHNRSNLNKPENKDILIEI
jgi:hypothetical protein